MPTYTVTSIAERLSPAQKERVAAAITGIHCTVTGSRPYLVQVVFQDLPEGNVFVAGKHLKFDTIIIVGSIRSDRKREARKGLALEIMHSVAAIAETDRTAVQVYIADLPASQIAEWGRASAGPREDVAADAGAPPELLERIRLLNS